MSNQVEERAAHLERLIASLLDTGRPLDFSASLLPGRCNFRMQTTADMSGRLIGYNGVHLRSLQLIAQLIGKELGQEWHLRLEEPEDERRGPKRKDVVPDSHDGLDDALMLEDVLEACGVNANVHLRGGIAGGFDFMLDPRDQEANAALLDPHEACFEHNQRDKTPLNLIQALRYILKAIGRKSGVQYRIEIQ